VNFVQALEQMAGGAAAAELDVALRDLLRQIRRTNQPGKLTLNVSFRPSGDGQVECDYTVSSKRPEPRRKETIFFLDGEDNLSRQSPKQYEMDLEVNPVSGIE